MDEYVLEPDGADSVLQDDRRLCSAIDFGLGVVGQVRLYWLLSSSALAGITCGLYDRDVDHARIVCPG